MMTPPDELLVAGEPEAVLQVFAPGDWTVEQALSLVEDVPRWTFHPADLDEADARRRVARSIDRAREGLATRYVIRTGGVPVGSIGLSHLEGTSPDLFYALLPAGRGAGIATRSVAALAEWALSHGAESVRVRTMVGNEASEAVARRAGFAFTEELVDEFDGARLRAWTRIA